MRAGNDRTMSWFGEDNDSHCFEESREDDEEDHQHGLDGGVVHCDETRDGPCDSVKSHSSPLDAFPQGEDTVCEDYNEKWAVPQGTTPHFCLVGRTIQSWRKAQSGRDSVYNPRERERNESAREGGFHRSRHTIQNHVVAQMDADAQLLELL